MNFSDFYTQSQNLPFTVALAVVTLLSLLEGVAFLLGFGVLSFIDSLLPDVDFDLDGPQLEDSGFVSKTLSFFKVKNVPVIILFVCFLTAFGLSGLFIQSMWFLVFGFLIHPLFILPFAILFGLTLMKGFGSVIANIFPGDETDANSLESFVSSIGIVTLGEVKAKSPAQCKVKDKIGLSHYFMVLPDNDLEVFKQGEDVLLVRYQEPYFYCIKPTKSLIDQE